MALAAQSLNVARKLIDESALHIRIAQLGEMISLQYADVDELILIGILKGSFVFLSDLTRQITVPHMIEFLQVSSYGIGARESSGTINLNLDIQTDLTNKHVLIVEDIIDSGNTLSFIVQHLQRYNPADVAICTLLDKPSRRQVPVDVAYVGFEIPDEFIVGYGIDADEQFRHLPYIASVDG
jgi:hypoxanthine phosphoribosyltransferase